MLTDRFLQIYGIASIAIMGLLLLLVWQGIIPREYQMVAFGFVLLLFLGRIVLRILVARRGASDDEPDLPA